MKNAFSMSSNRSIKADNDKINYPSYNVLYLTCSVCNEIVFFKKGSDLNNSVMKRAAHFSLN